MSKKSKKALLFGASGLVGGYLLRILLDDDRYSEIKIMVRQSLEIAHPKLIELVVDFNNIHSYAEEFRTDHIYVALGTTIKKAKTKKEFKKIDLELPYSLAKIGHAMGAKKLAIVSSIGADVDSNFFYSKVKGKLEDKLAGIPYKLIAIMRPSFLLGDREEFRMGEKIGEFANSIFQHFMVGKLSKYKAIKAEHVALAMVKIMASKAKGLKFYENSKMQKLSKTADSGNETI